MIWFLMRVKIQPRGCWIWSSGLFRSGYGCAVYKGKSTRAHRLSYEIFVGEIQNELEVCHSCDNKACVNPFHLNVGTHLENMKQAKDRNRLWWTKGSSKHNAVFTESQVLELRSVFTNKQGWLSAKASELGVSHNAIRSAIRGETWKYLPNAIPSRGKRNGLLNPQNAP